MREYLGIQINTSNSRLLTEQASVLLNSFYLRDFDKSPQEAFARAAVAFSAGDLGLAQRIYDAVSKQWFMYSSPVLSNAPMPGEKTLGMPISCFLTYVGDNLESLIEHNAELAWLSVKGGGVGGHWGDVRAISDKAPGPIPFMKVVDSQMMAYKQGKCYTPDTEVLTSKGFVRFDELTGKELVASVNKARVAEFVKPLEFIKEYHKGELIHFEGASTDLLVTPDHSMVIEKAFGNGADTGLLEKVRAEDCKLHTDNRIHVAANSIAGDFVENEYLTRLRVAFQADGFCNYTDINNLDFITFHFSKERKIERLKYLLQQLEIDFNINKVKDGTTNITFKYPSDILKKDFSGIPLNSSTTLVLLQELQYWDGYRPLNRELTVFTTISKLVAEQVVAMCAMTGKRCTFKIRERGGNRQLQYHLTLWDSYKPITGQSIDKSTEYGYEGLVYCCTVPDGMLVVRRNNKVSICGNTRKGSYAAYMDISHPDIIEFINLRMPTGGDTDRKCLNLHNAVNITDAFMDAVMNDKQWVLVDPSNGKLKDAHSARELWQRLLEVRYRTGEPYLNFIDTARAALPMSLKDLGLDLKGSNLCNEIHLPTNEERTAVCCLSSLNIDKFDEWKDTSLVQDLIIFLDNVLQYFIENAPDDLHKAVFSASRERSLGLGAFGFHSYLQSKNIPFESASAVGINHKVFKHIKQQAVEATEKLAIERGEYLDGIGYGRRNSHLLAIAPNANSSIIGNSSPSIEPWKSNCFTHRTRVGSHLIRNRHLQGILEEYCLQLGEDPTVWTEKQWQNILEHKGSVQQLDYFSDWHKDVFKTAFELDQHWVVQHAADRQEYICQGQSVNVFFKANEDKGYVNSVHLSAWSKGCKGLYYLRTESGATPDAVSTKVERQALSQSVGDQCLACEG